MNKTAPICPSCGKPAALVDQRFSGKHACCGLWSWGGKPLADRRTHEARKAAHRAFDPVWKSGDVKRGVAYQHLAEELGIARADCHMSIMTAELAERVPAVVAALWPDRVSA